MYKAKNISHQEEGIAWIAVFAPWETREVSENVFKRLQRNPNFECTEFESLWVHNTFVEEENDPIQKKKKK
jgi:hypothetical protein